MKSEYRIAVWIGWAVISACAGINYEWNVGRETLYLVDGSKFTVPVSISQLVIIFGVWNLIPLELFGELCCVGPYGFNKFRTIRRFINAVFSTVIIFFLSGGSNLGTLISWCVIATAWSLSVDMYLWSIARSIGWGPVGHSKRVLTVGPSDQTTTLPPSNENLNIKKQADREEIADRISKAISLDFDKKERKKKSEHKDQRNRLISNNIETSESDKPKETETELVSVSITSTEVSSNETGPEVPSTDRHYSISAGDDNDNKSSESLDLGSDDDDVESTKLPPPPTIVVTNDKLMVKNATPVIKPSDFVSKNLLYTSTLFSSAICVLTIYNIGITSEKKDVKVIVGLASAVVAGIMNVVSCWYSANLDKLNQTISDDIPTFININNQSICSFMNGCCLLLSSVLSRYA